MAETGGGVSQAPTQRVNKGGSQFSDVSRYLTQNQPQGQRLASKLATGAVNAGNEARAGLTNAQQHFADAVGRQTRPYDANLVNRVSSNPTGLYNFPTPQVNQPATPQTQAPQLYDSGRGSGRGNAPMKGNRNVVPRQSMALYVAPTPVQAPTQMPTAANQGDIDAYKALIDSTYSGPTDLTQEEGFGAATNKAQEASKLSDQLTDSIGQEDLLKGIYGDRGSFGSAMNLDRLLLQGGGARDVLKKAASRNEGLGGLFSNAITGASDAAKAAGETNVDTANRAREALSSQYAPIQKSIEDRLADEKVKAMMGVKNTGPNPRRRQAEATANALTPENVASLEDYQKIQALNDLLGENYTI